ncbi:hypothetical protein CBR65_18030 [Cellvibrio sp. PSBB006]|nr:hypothetical protein CBR65_18030 [Cellvibrio sp. PSBB006]
MTEIFLVQVTHGGGKRIDALRGKMARRKRRRTVNKKKTGAFTKAFSEPPMCLTSWSSHEDCYGSDAV